jgi:hypothetical protein
LKLNAIFLIQATAVLLSLLRWVPEVEFSRECRDRMWRARKRRRDQIVALKFAVHLPYARQDKGAWREPYWAGTPFTAAFAVRAAGQVDERAA